MPNHTNEIQHQQYVLKGEAKVMVGNEEYHAKAGDFIYISGTSSRRPDNSIEGASTDANGRVQMDIRIQTRAVIENIADILASMDAALSDLLELSCFLVDMEDFDGFNEVYAEYFDETGPTRTTVAVAQLPHPHLAIEIKAVAYKPAPNGGD